MTEQEWEFYVEEVETIWIREKQINPYTDLKLMEIWSSCKDVVNKNSGYQLKENSDFFKVIVIVLSLKVEKLLFFKQC